MKNVLLCGVCLVVLATGAAWAAISPARVVRTQISLPEDVSSVPALDRYVVARTLGEDVVAEEALEDPAIPDHLRAWLAAVEALRRGEASVAAAHFARARDTWPEARGEAEAVLATFDAQRLRNALELGDAAYAHQVRSSPLSLHPDAVWAALGGQLALLDGDARAAAARLDAAWEGANRWEREDPAFFHRALAHLAAGDSLRAGHAWVETLEVMRRPENLRAGAAVYDANPGLARVCDREGLREPVLRWLVRLLRRDDAFEWAARAWREADPEEACRLYVFAAEQLYRLRRHAELEAWLQGERPRGLNEEQEAALAAYPWGVRRRAGSSREIGRGFLAVADAHPTTARAAEAVWEAAWMFELDDDPEEATRAYERYVESTRGGRLRRSAALRALLVPARAGAPVEELLDRYRRVRAALGDGMQEAGALALMADRLEAAGETERAEAFRDTLRIEHPASPLWRAVPPHRSQRHDDVWTRVEALHRHQERGMDRVARALGFRSLRQAWNEIDPRVAAAGRLAELGLATEAEARLDALARLDQADDAMRFAVVSTAWRWGLPELHGRHAWWLERRIPADEPALREAVAAVALPTPYAATVLELAQELDLVPELIWSVARRESFFDADVVSLAGAYGLMQLLPSTAERVARAHQLEVPSPTDLFVPRVNLGLGARYLRGLLDESGEDLVEALSAYNAGEGNGRRWRSRRSPKDSPSEAVFLISYSETRAYVYNVMRIMHMYRDAQPSLRVH